MDENIDVAQMQATLQQQQHQLAASVGEIQRLQQQPQPPPPQQGEEVEEEGEEVEEEGGGRGRGRGRGRGGAEDGGGDATEEAGGAIIHIMVGHTQSCSSP